MDFDTYETITRFLQKFFSEQLEAADPEERVNLQRQFDAKFKELQKQASVNGSGGAANQGFIDLIGFGDDGLKPFSKLAYPYLDSDFDDAVTPSQLHAAADLYFLYQHEKMRLFKVVDILKKLFRSGKMKVHQGPGARALYVLEKWQPLRYSVRDRMIAYKRVFNYGQAQAPAGAVVNRNFHRQLVGFMGAMAQFYRDLTIGEVIRGSQNIEHYPYGHVATIQRIGVDLRYALDRSSYGNIVALTHESGHYLNSVMELLDSPDIKKAFDATNKWDVIEAVSSRYLGGVRELSQRAKMADSGRRILQWVADQSFNPDVDPTVFRAEAQSIGSQAEAWIAAYRMTAEGSRFPGAMQALRTSIGAKKFVPIKEGI